MMSQFSERSRFILVKKNASQKICVEVASAVSSYFADYERFPIAKVAAGVEVMIDTATDGEFLGILNASGETQYNPRHLKYIDGMQQAKFTNGQWVNGINFEDNPEAPTLTDPWGKGYKVVLDADANGEIANPEQNATNPKILGKKCLVYGAGADGDYTTWADNPKSW